MLELCFSDAPPELKQYVATYLNGDWNQGSIDHWCVPGCPCGRTERSSEEHTRRAVDIMCGPDCPLALEYRWKHMPEANSWSYRSRALHDIGGRAFEAGFTREKIGVAQVEVAAAVAAGLPVENLVAQNQTIKAGKIIDYMKLDPGGQSHCTCLVMQKPLHAFLLDAFKAEKFTTITADILLALPDDGSPLENKVLSGDALESFNKALTLNLSIILGRKGELAIDTTLASTC